MAETDFIPMYAQTDPSLRPSLVSRQSGAGWRAPGFIGQYLSGAQPQAAPQAGATSSGDGTAALRGLYAARSNEDYGVGNSQGAVSGGQQPTREAQSFTDLLASAAMGGLALTGPGGFGAYMNAQDRRANQTDPVTMREFGQAVNPFGTGNSTFSRALGAAYDALRGGANNGGVPGFDPVTGMAPGEKSLGIDRSVTSEPLDPIGGANNGGVPGFDSVTGMAPGEQSLGIDRSVQSSELGPVGGGAGAGTNSDPGPSTQGDPTGGMGPEHLRTGGFVGQPGSKPVPRPIVAHTGEAVMRPEAVNKYGPSAMQAINSMKAPAPAVQAATRGAPPPAKKGAPPPAKKGAPPAKKGGGGMDALAKLKASR